MGPKVWPGYEYVVSFTSLYFRPAQCGTRGTSEKLTMDLELTVKWIEDSLDIYKVGQSVYLVMYN